MSEMSREDLLAVVREVYEQADPMPDDLVSRMQAALAVRDLDDELLLLVESELVGVRGASSYTLRFASDEVDVLLRIAVEGDRSRVDGWVVPAEAMTVRVMPEAGPSQATVLNENGRFELTNLPLGLHRIRLEPHDAGRASFATPTFEI